jgi:hypothetical protein
MMIMMMKKRLKCCRKNILLPMDTEAAIEMIISESEKRVLALGIHSTVTNLHGCLRETLILSVAAVLLHLLG